MTNKKVAEVVAYCEENKNGVIRKHPIDIYS